MLYYVESALMGCVDFAGVTDAQEEQGLWPDHTFGDTTQPKS